MAGSTNIRSAQTHCKPPVWQKITPLGNSIRIGTVLSQYLRFFELG